MLPNENRLKKGADFQKTWKKGKSFYGRSLGFKLLKNNLKISRFGIIVSNKISKKSTVRNKIKRQIRAALRLKINQIKPGHDLIINALPAITEKNYQEIEKEISLALKHFKILSL